MFEKFSPNLIKVIAFAQEEAKGLDQSVVNAEHLLLGLVRLPDDQAAHILRARGLTLTTVIKEITTDRYLCLQPDLESGSAELGLSESAKHVLELAYQAARDMNCKECSTQHLVLALLRNDRTNQILEKLTKANLAIENEARSLSPSIAPPISDPETLRKQILAWQNRAEMARKQGNEDLVLQALAEKNKYEQLLNKLQ